MKLPPQSVSFAQSRKEGESASLALSKHQIPVPPQHSNQHIISRLFDLYKKQHLKVSSGCSVWLQQARCLPHVPALLRKIQGIAKVSGTLINRLTEQLTSTVIVMAKNMCPPKKRFNGETHCFL